MKRLNTDLATSDVGLVLQHKHLDFLQDKTEESLIHAIYSQLGGIKTIPVVLYGCIPTFSTTTNPNDTLTISDGAISYNGNIYEISGGSVVKTGVNVHLLKLSTVAYDASDPSLFTDNISRDVQEIHKIELGQGVTGSGIVDWADRTVLNLTESGVCGSQTSFDVLMVLTGPTGTITSANYKIIKSGNFVSVEFRILYEITALGGGNNFVNFNFTPIATLRPGASKPILSSINNTNTTYDPTNIGDVSVDGSGVIKTQYDNTFVAVTGANQAMKITATYLTA